jgi:Cu(I)/Ag(I) efflux system membrane fusion protein
MVYSHELVTAQQNLILAINKGNQALLDAARQRLIQFSIAPSAIKQIEKDLRIQERLPVLAAESGLVDEVRVRPGEFVRIGQPLFTLQDPVKRWATAEIAPRNIDILESDVDVSITTFNRPETPLKARILGHIPSVDPRSRKHRVRIAIENPAVILQADELVDVELQARTSVDALVIPRTALINNGNQNFIAVMHDNGEYEFRLVETGIEDRTHIEVKAGLKEGERVVVSGQFLLDSTATPTRSYNSNAEPAEAERVWVKAHITSSTPDFGMVEVHHEAIKEWAWPPMRMEFEVLDSTLWPKLKQGSQVEIKITKTGYGFGIIEVRSAEANHGMTAIEPAERAVNQDHHDASRQPEKSFNHLHHGHGEQTDKSTEPSLQDPQEQEDRPMEHAHLDHGGQL